MSAWWDEDHELCLLTPEEFEALPDGTELTAIDDEVFVKGSGESFDDDTRMGHLSYGVTGDHPLRLALLAKTKAARS